MKVFVLHILGENISSFGGFLREIKDTSFKIKDIFKANDFKAVWYSQEQHKRKENEIVTM